MQDCYMIEYRDSYRTYRSPIQTIRRSRRKVGRNEKCPCGSGRKFKNCCMEKEVENG